MLPLALVVHEITRNFWAAYAYIRLATKYKSLQFYDLPPQEYRQKTTKTYQVTQRKLHNYKT